MQGKDSRARRVFRGVADSRAGLNRSSGGTRCPQRVDAAQPRPSPIGQRPAPSPRPRHRIRHPASPAFPALPSAEPRTERVGDNTLHRTSAPRGRKTPPPSRLHGRRPPLPRSPKRPTNAKSPPRTRRDSSAGWNRSSGGTRCPQRVDAASPRPSAGGRRPSAAPVARRRARVRATTPAPPHPPSRVARLPRPPVGRAPDRACWGQHAPPHERSSWAENPASVPPPWTPSPASALPKTPHKRQKPAPHEAGFKRRVE